MAERRGVLLMHHGTPASAEEIEPFYTRIRRGRPPTPEQLADLTRRYDAIGGLSPLTARTAAQVAGVQRALGDDWVAVAGAKHVSPSVEDGIAALARAGARRVAGIVLAPHYSPMSVGDYLARAQAAATGEGVELRAVESWHLQPALIDLLAARVDDAHTALAGREPVATLITAHSLPARILESDDPYPNQLAATAAAVAARAGIEQWSVAYQSAGRTPEPWLGPDVLDAIRALPETLAQGVVICPAGFTADHLEVLFDIDIEARAVADEAGIALARTVSLNDDPAFCELIADLAREATA